jgi:hypothetical protein
MYKVLVTYRRGAGFTRGFDNYKAARAYYNNATRMRGISKVELRIPNEA